ncbi:MAG: DUF4277 domain-containing protein [bacterium]
MKITSTQTINVGPIPLILPIIRSLRIKETIDSICPMERKADKGITHGQVIEALIVNRLIAPKPLYGVKNGRKRNIIANLFNIPFSAFLLNVLISSLYSFNNLRYNALQKSWNLPISL